MKKGISLSGEIMVFKNDKGYSTTISNKKMNGEWEKMYITLNLPKGVEIGNMGTMAITKGFLSFYKDKNGMPKPKIVVRECSILTYGEEVEIKEDFETQDQFIPSNDDDLPF